MLLAQSVDEIECTLEAGKGKQHFALGIVDLVDMGDLPTSYEDKPGGGYEPAMHVSHPNLSTPLTTGWYFLYKEYNGTPIETIDYYQELLNAPTAAPSDYAYTIDIENDTMLRTPIEPLITPELRIGHDIDYEESPHSSANATGDDTNGIDDEDLYVPFLLSNCESKVYVTNKLAQKTYLHYWLDKNGDGDFQDADDIYGKVEVAANHEGNVTLPPFTTLTSSGEYFMRFRLSKETNLTYYGSDDYGEVEDVKKKFLLPSKGAITQNTSCTGNGTIELKDIQNYSTIEQFYEGALQKTFTFSGVAETSNGGLEVTTNDTIIGSLLSGNYTFVVTPSLTYSGSCPDTFTATITDNLGSDADNDGVKDYCDLDDDNDGILDINENNCMTFPAPEASSATALTWDAGGFSIFVDGGYHDALGYQKSGFEARLINENLPYYHLNTNKD